MAGPAGEILGGAQDPEGVAAPNLSDVGFGQAVCEQRRGDPAEAARVFEAGHAAAAVEIAADADMIDARDLDGVQEVAEQIVECGAGAGEFGLEAVDLEVELGLLGVGAWAAGGLRHDAGLGAGQFGIGGRGNEEVGDEGDLDDAAARGDRAQQIVADIARVIAEGAAGGVGGNWGGEARRRVASFGIEAASR